MSHIKALINANRSYRRFQENHVIERETLKELIDLARLSPSAANLQPLKYIISSNQEKNELIFPHLAWAGYLKEWIGPVEGERPSAYVIVLRDRQVTPKPFPVPLDCDHGIAVQSILLGAVEKGLGGCIIGALQRDKLAEALAIPEQYEILLVIALGKPIEEIVIEPLQGDIKYWRDDQKVHHVPKRNLKDIIL
ncbi:nitroreductase family protein [Heliorestis acidaminivorans]|uniref:Nitroreductase family protein n=1 Tax=Heliorestis acidaminivorans TaxID=553427 RepID=A0A6I0F0G1_9FIRM|nr:nitroreductase family protein [Heliorestis acidaminivorans]KAB2953346.1 nitroreductase family protein [Heliorestis acidaminivorans]